MSTIMEEPSRFRRTLSSRYLPGTMPPCPCCPCPPTRRRHPRGRARGAPEEPRLRFAQHRAAELGREEAELVGVLSRPQVLVPLDEIGLPFGGVGVELPVVVGELPVKRGIPGGLRVQQGAA